MSDVRVVQAAGDGAEVDAATIWARAKARRDGLTEPPPVASTLDGVRRRLELPGSTLLLAMDGVAVIGFAVTAHRTSSLEVFYLAVDPAAWGNGVGSLLLTAIDEHARTTGHHHLELLVVDDNQRAIGVYLRAGWTDTGELRADSPDTRLQRQLVKRLEP